MLKKMKKIVSDFKAISWAKPKEVLIGIKDVLIFAFLIGGLCLIIDLIASIIIKGIGG